MVELGRAEALGLLASAPIGRIVFTRHALPAIRPVNHVVDQGDIVIRTHEGAALSSAAEQAGPSGVVVAYEADSIDPDTRLGWSVVVTGYARLITDPELAARYRLLLHLWVDQGTDYTVRIRPDLVTGYRLVPAPTV
jgi:nitroimidazol reductase NimA-like FMN-containing flavoprotein (pyridoxamine 5'-phosphate oxidase superfamily)